MTAQPSDITASWPDAIDALTLLAIDPAGLGGASLRGPPGPVRDAWLSALRERVPSGVPVRRVPANISQQRLLGGLDLAATLQAGRPIAERGLLAQAHGGVLILAMAERITPAATSHVSSALDTGAVQLERDGLTANLDASLCVIALDEGLTDDERTPGKLLDRLAFHIDLTGLAPRDTTAPLPDPAVIAAARTRLPDVDISDDIIEAITSTALALGISSLRAALQCVKAARARAAWAGRTRVDPDDATLAASLVLAPRATQVPQSASQEDAQPDPPGEPSQPEPRSDAQPPPPPPETNATDAADPPPPTPSELADLLLGAIKAALPAGLLAQLQQAGAVLNKTRTHGRSGVERAAARGGRPAGTRRGDPRDGARLNVIETLRAAAPWQTLRRREIAQRRGPHAPGDTSRIEVRRSDFHVNRTKQKSQTATIFVVDASGSSALNRLAEAKGAVELLLADCYIRRDQVAVLAFRGTRAEILLPPTRSLVRAKRALAGLPGGGATPLAAAIDAAAGLADAVRRKGLTPTLIVLTDGRANIARDGSQGRERAQADALTAAKALRALTITTLLIDTSPKPQPQAELLARTMSALYVPLPFADATRLAKAVLAVSEAR